MQLSPHFSIEELTVTTHRDIPNVPPSDKLENLKRLAGCMEEVRSLLNCPLISLSGLRCAELNCVVGGAMTEQSLTALIITSTLQFVRVYAQHRLDVRNIQKSDSRHMRGEADDFIAPTAGSPYEICRRLMDSDIQFDELIWEGTWVHISFAFSGKPRRLILTYVPGKPYLAGLVDRRSNQAA